MLDLRVRELIAAQLRRQHEEIRDELHVADDLGADSLDQTELLLAFEQEFDLKLEMPATGLGTVEQTIERLRRALEGQAVLDQEQSSSRA
ncbi:MAG TPA: phosphopantetheine-binding protein [Polyangiaceae bacterium]|nr:phosphopantetheine-binding protein [Polyangiaceae bacterium]